MSLESWKTEFYTIEAREVAEENAAAHSLQKWIGLWRENMEKHGVFVGYKEIMGTNSPASLNIDGDSCALCVHHAIARNSCEECPLFVYLGKTCDGEPDSPYGYWLDTADPEPMIAALSEILMEKK